MVMAEMDGKAVLESFHPEMVFSEDDLKMTRLMDYAKNKNGLYHKYFTGLLGFVKSCELAVGPYSFDGFDIQVNVEKRRDLYSGLSDAILDLLSGYNSDSLDLGTIYQLASQKYPDSFHSKEDYQYALQLALFGKLDEKTFQYIPEPEKSANASMNWHCRVVGDYASCLKSFIDTFGIDQVRSIIAPELYELSNQQDVPTPITNH